MPTIVPSVHCSDVDSLSLKFGNNFFNCLKTAKVLIQIFLFSSILCFEVDSFRMVEAIIIKLWSQEVQ